MTTNAKLYEEYLSLVAADADDAQHRRDAWDYMTQSTAIYHGENICPSYLPRMYGAHSLQILSETAKTMYSVIEKVLLAYKADPEFRNLFTFDPRLEELMLLPQPYDSILPICRIDLFLNEETDGVKFCEFNADGSSGMNENREVLGAISQSAPFVKFSQRHTMEDDDDRLFEGWIDEFLRIYHTCNGAIDSPHVAIIDYLGNSILGEFNEYVRRFEARGIRTSIIDIRNLRYEDGAVYGEQAEVGYSNLPIDVAWKRCVASDVIEHWNESDAFLDAIRDGALITIGNFLGHVMHDKQIFRILHDPRALAILTEEEQAFVKKVIPYTAFLDGHDTDIEAVKANPSRWIIKPTDLYGSQKAFAGRDYDVESWSALVDRLLSEPQKSTYIVQEYCIPYQSPVLALYGNDEDYAAAPKQFYNMSGLFLFDGHFSGVFQRQGPASIILGTFGGITPAVLWVDANAQDILYPKRNLS